uniref:Odorant-binding protein 1 n=1 Tax=Delia platura TaxID=81723 RepID=A0A0P0UVK3_9MUSC|nr:odorant-binding protein 1 [Delia platura]
MKFLVVFAFVAMAVCSIRAELTKEEAIAIVHECKEAEGASDADVEAMMKHEPADSKEGKCMRACALKKFGVLSEDGKLIKDASIELTKRFIKDEDKKELATEVIEACEALEVNEDHCEAASEYGACIKKEFELKELDSSAEI